MDLIKKAIDELWQDIQQGQSKKMDTGCSNDSEGGGGYDLDRKPVIEKQQTLGEMTLEDFLAKEGIVAKSSEEKKISTYDVGAESISLSQQNINPQQAQWMQYQTPPIQHQQHMLVSGHHHVHQPLPRSATMDAAYSETQMTTYPSPLMRTLSDAQAPRRKRDASGDMMEKAIERRQKRMIKNRESAARSRARKQAYTHELENKVSHLEEENERLKREQDAENVLPYLPLPEPKYQLRRTSSALF